MCNVFGEDELGGSQRSSARVEDLRTHLVELIAEVYGVDAVTLEVGEHDYLDKALARKMASKGRICTKKTMVKRRPAAIRTEKRKSHPRGTEGKGSKRSDPAPERRKRAQTCTTHDDR